MWNEFTSYNFRRLSRTNYCSKKELVDINYKDINHLIAHHIGRLLKMQCFACFLLVFSKSHFKMNLLKDFHTITINLLLFRKIYHDNSLRSKNISLKAKKESVQF